MEKPSKKTKTHGGASRSSRSAPDLVDTTFGRRQPNRDRRQSPPLGLPHIKQHQQWDSKLTTSGIPDTARSSSRSPSPSSVLIDDAHASGSGGSQHPNSLPQKHVSNVQHLQQSTASSYTKNRVSADIQETVLAVVGVAASGKSTFMHCALDLKAASTLPVASKKVSLEGTISIIRLLEVGLEDMEVTMEGEVRWPKEVGNQRMPAVDGVLALYDVMNPNSIAPLFRALSESPYSLAMIPFSNR